MDPQGYTAHAPIYRGVADLSRSIKGGGVMVGQEPTD